MVLAAIFTLVLVPLLCYFAGAYYLLGSCPSLSFQIAGVDDSTTEPAVFVKDENGHLIGQLFEEPALTKIIESAPKPTLSCWNVDNDCGAAKRLCVSWAYHSYRFSLCHVKSDDTEITNGMLNILKNVPESESCSARLALYRVVHGLDDSSSNSKPNAMRCPSLVRFDGSKVEINI